MKILVTCEVDDAQLERFNAKRGRLGLQHKAAFDVVSEKLSDALSHCEEVVIGSTQVREMSILEDVIASMTADPTMTYSLECGIRQIEPQGGYACFESTNGRTLTLHTNGGAKKEYRPCPLTVVEPTHGTEYSVTHRPCQLHEGHAGLCC